MRWVLSLALGVLVLCGPVASSQAHGSAMDRASTSVYVSARHRFFLQAVKAVGPAQEAVKSYVKQVGSECVGVLAGAPKGEQLWDFLQEEVDAFAAVADPTLIRLLTPVAKTFSRTVGRVRWLNPKLSREFSEVDPRISQDRPAGNTGEGTPPPELCADYRAWVASGYKVLPPTTERLAHAGESSSSESLQGHKIGFVDRSLWNKLARYETPRVRVKAHATQRLELKYAERFIGALFSASDELGGL